MKMIKQHDIEKYLFSKSNLFFFLFFSRQFYDLIQHSEARDELKNEVQMTLFVPTDKAMERINKEKLDQQRQNPQALKEVHFSHYLSTIMSLLFSISFLAITYF